jgi:hypothetical protein
LKEIGNPLQVDSAGPDNYRDTTRRHLTAARVGLRKINCNSNAGKEELIAIQTAASGNTQRRKNKRSHIPCIRYAASGFLTGYYNLNYQPRHHLHALYIIMQKFTAILFLQVFSTLCSFGQIVQSTDSLRCFPSGTSIRRAILTEDGRHILFNSVTDIWRAFEIATGKMELIWQDKDFTKFSARYIPYKPIDASLQKNYRLDYKLVNGLYELKLYDSTGKLINEITPGNTGGDNWALNARNGDVLVSGKTVYLYKIGEKAMKISGKKKPPYDICKGAKFSPDGKYLVSENGIVTNLQTKKIVPDVFPDKGYGAKEYEANFRVFFDDAGTSFTIATNSFGLQTYSLATLKQTDSVPIPSEFRTGSHKALLDIFKVIMLPNGKDYIYWLQFYNTAAAAGMAYYVRDGVALTLCDPGWSKESANNWKQLLADAEANAQRAAIAEEKRKKEQEAYERMHPATSAVSGNSNATTTERKYVRATCNYCKGAGTVSFEKLIMGNSKQTSFTIDQYGNKTYKTTGGIQTIKCSSCRGTGTVMVME